jgi:Ca2+/H+ antiporter, TMEM165/GDT1 family
VNALIPALVAVLLAELGGRVSTLGEAQRPLGLAAIAGAAIAAAAVGGSLLAPSMTPWARLLLLALALIFGGVNQFAKHKTLPDARGLGPSILLVWRSSAPFSAFAFSAWLAAPIGSAAGAILGLGIAVASAPLARLTRPRQAMGSLLILGGLISALMALRLV